ncbi:MAG: hypothetical protein WCT48_02920 [Candidatus Paceibacterota bacterium]|jgi:transcription elongation factor Elf1
MSGKVKIYTVVCGECGKEREFHAEDINHIAGRYCNVPATEGGEKPFIIDRYHVVCLGCGAHMNVARIASQKMKKAAKARGEIKKDWSRKK